jgi:multicomponent Na+:H+ antiporter subunit D
VPVDEAPVAADDPAVAPSTDVPNTEAPNTDVPNTEEAPR